MKLKKRKSNLKSLILNFMPIGQFSVSLHLSISHFDATQHRRRHHSTTATRAYLKLQRSYSLILTFSSTDLAQV